MLKSRLVHITNSLITEKNAFNSVAVQSTETVSQCLITLEGVIYQTYEYNNMNRGLGQGNDKRPLQKVLEQNKQTGNITGNN